MPPTATPRRPVLMSSVMTSWGRILCGFSPLLSIELTREYPLQCPGCYAYTDNHLGGDVTLRQLHDLRGTALVDRVMELVQTHRPLQINLLRYRERVQHVSLPRPSNPAGLEVPIASA